jgi:aspartyl-tRNA(Asn)/glutamyl-tRNA(Gln) amidotransferase subunit C
MSLKADDVNKIAHLARLGINAEDVDNYARDLSGILELVTQLEALDTTDVQPMAHPMDQTQRLREDRVSEVDQHKLFQSLAPQVEAGLYLVPKVID